MEKYFCPNCREIYNREDLSVYYERGEYWGAPYVQEELVCPNCMENVIYIDNVHYCDSCGDVCIDNFIETSDDKHYCSDCYIRRNIDD